MQTPINNKPPKATVIISVYNNLKFLQLVLAGLECQAEQDFEVIVSDDGSGKVFVEGLQHIIQNSSLSIRHNWHEDIGFRKNKILNSSIQKALSEYLIFIDGDCIPHTHFVAEHLKQAKEKTCLVGRRVDLSERITRKLTVAKIHAGYLSSATMLLDMSIDYLQGKLAHIKTGIYIKNKLLRKLFNRKERGLLGANFSLYKSDILAINGFDERYDQPTFGEDSDIEFRLRINGIKFRPLISIAVMYHCYHKLLPRPEASRLLYEKAKQEHTAFTPYGIYKTGGSS